MNAKDHLRQFLEKHCPEPEALLTAFLSQAARHVSLHDGASLLTTGHTADEMWIVLQGELRVLDRGTLITTRGGGEIVGEAAFYRNGGRDRTRGANLMASGDTVVFRIDAAFVLSLTLAEQALWHQTVASALVQKLDEGQHSRAVLRLDRYRTEEWIDRFVGPEGRAAVQAMIDGSSREVEPEVLHALFWFSDIAGFTSVASALTPSDSGRLVREIMGIQAELIIEAAGEVDKFMGDGMMAFWRTPDESRRQRFVPGAIKAALEVRDRIVEIAKSRSVAIDIRIGLHLGTAIFGDFGGGTRIAFTAIGAAVNTASRYEQARACSAGKALGRVRLSDTVLRHIQGSPLRALFDPEERTFLDKNGSVYRFVSSHEENFK